MPPAPLAERHIWQCHGLQCTGASCSLCIARNSAEGSLASNELSNLRDAAAPCRHLHLQKDPQSSSCSTIVCRPSQPAHRFYDLPASMCLHRRAAARPTCCMAAVATMVRLRAKAYSASVRRHSRGPHDWLLQGAPQILCRRQHAHIALSIHYKGRYEYVWSSVGRYSSNIKRSSAKHNRADRAL